MERTTIPLILPSTARGWAATVGTSAKDQQLINGLYVISQNTQAGSKTVYLQKRAGSTTLTTVDTNLIALKTYSATIANLFTGGTTKELYRGTDSMGVITNPLEPLTNYVVPNAIIGDLSVVAFVTTTPEGWYLYSDASTNNFPTFDGDRTSGSPNLENVASIVGIYPGQALSGTGIPADTRVLSASSSTVVMTKNATSGTGTPTTVTKEAVSKITDAQFPSNANSMEFLDGYFFAGTDSGDVYQSAINDPSSWASSDVIAADYEGDEISFIFKWQNYIVAAGSRGTIQYFYNAGNASGSVLSTAENLTVQGLALISRPVLCGGVGYCVAHPTIRSGGGSAGLYSLTGANTYTRVSDDFWSSVIEDGSRIIVSIANIGNKSVLLLHGTAGSANPVIYDPSSNQFSVLDAGTVTSSFIEAFTISGSSAWLNWASGNTWTDSDVAYTLTAQTEPKSLNNGNSIIIESVDLIADTESTGEATLYMSEDDGQNWQLCGTFDMTQAIKRIDGIGWIPSSVAFRVQHSANTNFRAQALVVGWAPCGH